MRCEDVQRALPLTDASAAEEDAIRVHASGCVECELLLEAFEADAQALEAFRAEAQALPPIMDGFADAVLAAVAREPIATASRPEPTGKVLRPVFGGASTLLAVAAMTLLAIGLGIVLSSTPEPSAQPLARTPEVAPTAPIVPVAQTSPLPAPRRSGEAPMPLRRRNAGIGVPVDGGRTPQLPSGPLFDVLRDVQRAFPGGLPGGLNGGLNQQTPQRVPPLRPGEREVRF